MRDTTIEWRDLLPLTRREVWGELGLPLPFLQLALVAGAAQCWPLVVVASCAMFMAGLRVTHNAFHRALGLSARGGDLVMFGLSVLLGGAMHAIEYTHLRHHRDCLADDDIEGRIASLGFWRALLDSPMYPLRIHVAALRDGTVRQRRWVRRELVAVAVVQALIWSSGNASLQWITASLWFANASAAMVGIWAVHRGCRRDDAQIARSTRSPWLARLTINMFHHGEHHHYPAVPACRLRELARRMDACGHVPRFIV